MVTENDQIRSSSHIRSLSISKTFFLRVKADGTQAGQSMDMSSSLGNLYLDTQPEPVFAQPGTVQSSNHLSLSHSAWDIFPPEQQEEGQVSEPRDQPDPDFSDIDKNISEDQNYRETDWGVFALEPHSGPGLFTYFMGR